MITYLHSLPLFLGISLFLLFPGNKKLSLLCVFLGPERPNHVRCMLVMIPAAAVRVRDLGFGVLLGARSLVATTRSEASRSSELKAEIWCGETQVHMGSADLPFLLLVIQSVKAVVDHSLSLKSPTSTHWMGPDLTSPVRNLARRRHMHNKAVFSLCANCRCKRWLSHVEASILATEITSNINLEL